MSAERNWGAEPWRAPDTEEGDSLIFSACGQVHAERAAHVHGAAMTRYTLTLLLRAVTACQIGVDMAALFAAAKLQTLRQKLVRALMR